MRDVVILLELAQAGAHTAPRKISSRELASRLGTSQQTTARWLIDLEKRGLITRIPSARGQSVQLTKAGISILRSAHRRLNSIFGARQQAIKLLGKCGIWVRGGLILHASVWISQAVQTHAWI